MNRIAGSIVVALAAVSLSAAIQPDPVALKQYAVRALTQCADEKVTLERVDQPGPSGFIPHTLNLTSSDTTCGRRAVLLYSPATQQVIIGAVFALPPDSRSVELRASDKASELMQEAVTVKLNTG